MKRGALLHMKDNDLSVQNRLQTVDNSNEKENIWLTTIDNPYDPFTQEDLWSSFDTQKGYCTMQVTARLVNLSDDWTIEQQEEEIKRIFREMAFYNISGMHVIVRPSDYKGNKWKNRIKELKS